MFSLRLVLPGMYLLYSILLTLGVILTAPYYWWRRRGEISSWRERFGRLPESYQQPEQGTIWVHAVSVGETLAVAGLVRRLQECFPARKIFLSHVTAAGRAAGEGRLPGVAGRFYLPLDWRWAVGAALARIRPSLLVVVETELWPNLLRAARESGARVILVNARLSRRSLRGYLLVRPFMRRVVENVDRICAQTPTDAERFKRLGALPERIIETGNLKFDFQPPKLGQLAHRIERALARQGRGPVVIAASTMPGEEHLVIQAWEKIRLRYPKALLILAPRHPQRFGEVERFLVAGRRSFLRRTSLAEQEEALVQQLADPEVLLLDTIGELGGMFGLGDVVFMGGSLVPAGGHNLLEPAHWSKPVLFGPYMENFHDVAQLFLKSQAAGQVSDPRDLARAALTLLENAEARRRMGERAKELLARESGVTERVLDHVRELLESKLPLRANAGGVR